MEKLYNEARDKIIGYDYTTVLPISELNLNTPNNFTVFKLDHGDAFYDNRILFHIKGEVVKKSDGSTYADTDPIKLVDNFAAFLFKRIELKKHNYTIDTVDEVGITSMIKCLTTYSKSGENTYASSGLKSYFEHGGKFEALGTLAHLGLGFFDNLKYPMYKGGFEIIFTRAEDNDALFRWKTGTGASAVDAVEGKIKITSFVLRVPLVNYDVVKKTPLVEGLKKLSEKEDLVYRYHQWQCIEKFGVIGSTYTFDITNVYRNISNPLFVIIGLQTSRKNNQQKDPSQFDSVNIKSFHVKINGQRYPQEPQNMHITEKDYRLLYDSYLSIRQLIKNDNDVYLNLDSFINKYPLLVVDTHHHPFNIENKRNDIQVELEFTNAVSGPTADKGTSAYILVVSEMMFSYDLNRNIIKMY